MSPNIDWCRSGRTSGWLCITIVTLLAGGCQDKDGNYFLPNPFGPPIQLTDITPPTITNLRPATNIFLNDNIISFDAFDPPGATGEPVSGINPPAFRALYGTELLPITRVGAGNTYDIDISSISVASPSINVDVFDAAANKASASYLFRTDYSAPTVTWNGPSSGTSTQSSALVNFSGTYADNQSGIKLAKYYIRLPVNDQCVAAGAPFPTGTGPGTVSQNEFDLTGGAYDFDVTLNGPPNAQRPSTSIYCWYFHAEDMALDRNGISRPNVTDRFWKLTQTWNALAPSEGTITGRVRLNTTSALGGVSVSTAGKPSTLTDASGNYTFTGVPAGSATVSISNIPADVQCAPLSKVATVTAGQTTTVDFDCSSDFTLSLAMSYVHIGPGVSYSCVLVTGTAAAATGSEPVALENIAGASWTVQWSGPGVVGSTTRSGTLNAQSQALDRQQINLFGTYTANVSVTHRGLTKQASGTVTVGSSQGTCTPP